VRDAASMMVVASMSTEVSGISKSGHSHTNAIDPMAAMVHTERIDGTYDPRRRRLWGAESAALARRPIPDGSAC